MQSTVRVDLDVLHELREEEWCLPVELFPYLKTLK